MELEKLRLANTRLGMACRVDVRVMVLPEPGGPHSIKGLWEASHAFSTSTCLRSNKGTVAILQRESLVVVHLGNVSTYLRAQVLFAPQDTRVLLHFQYRQMFPGEANKKK